MALGEYRAARGAGSPGLVLIKIGTGIGVGLISGGRLHRGAQGSAGDIGHVGLTGSVPGAEQVVCRCGNVGCLEVLVGGTALARDATAAARQGRGEHLVARLAQLLITGLVAKIAKPKGSSAWNVSRQSPLHPPPGRRSGQQGYPQWTNKRLTNIR